MLTLDSKEGFYTLAKDGVTSLCANSLKLPDLGDNICFLLSVWKSLFGQM